MEYKLLSREELSRYTFDFWLKWGAFNWNSKTDEELLEEIYTNLGTLEGIEKELDSVRCEFESNCWSEESLEYENLDKLWNYLNWYKTYLQEMVEDYE